MACKSLKVVVLLVLGLLTLLQPGPASAQGFPESRITMVVGFGAGRWCSP